jgi:hypothetical protein
MIESTAMGRVTTSILKPGMVLSKPVFNGYRQQLAEAGTILNKRIITVLQTWGVIDVEVQEVSEPTLQEIEEQMSATVVLQQHSAMIDDRFYGADQHQFVAELRRLIKHDALKNVES